MSWFRAVLLGALACGAMALILVMVPSHARANPSVPGALPVLRSAWPRLDCGSVALHGPDWNAEGGTCWGKLAGRQLAAEAWGAAGVVVLLAGGLSVARRRLVASSPKRLTSF